MNYASLEEAMTSGFGIERSFLCHVHEDRNASASVNSVTGLWYCYTCHAAGRFDLSTMEIDPFGVRRSIEIMTARIEREERVYPESWLTQYDALGPGDYWLGRFGREVATLNRLGTSFSGQVATIPFRDNAGRVLGVIRRDLTGQDPAKYRYPSGVDMQHYLYNYHRVTGRTLILVEGAADAVAVMEAGVQDVVAVYGSRLSRAQVQLVHRLDPALVVTAFDRDTAGLAAHEMAVQSLQFYPVQRLTWPRWKDIAAVPLMIRRRLLRRFA